MSTLKKEYRRALQARHRATLAGLFQSLKSVVYPSIRNSPAKWKILDHAKGFLHEKEAYFSRLLLLKEVFLANDDGPTSLREVREQYSRLYSHDISPSTRRRSGAVGAPDVDGEPEGSEEDSAGDPVEEAQSQSSSLSAPNVQEFEGYLFFYRQMLELLLKRGVLAQDQTALPVVAEAISGLWSSLPPEQRASIQPCYPEDSSLCWAYVQPRSPEDCSICWVNAADQPLGLEATGLDSQPYSLDPSESSALEEDMFQDAYDLVQRDLDSILTDSQGLPFHPAVDHDKLRELHKDIMCFVKSHLTEELELMLELCQAADCEELFLRCSESLDEEF